jgi:hypothetical protein
MIDGGVPDGSDVFVSVKNEDELEFDIKTNQSDERRVPAESSAE